eukprot:GHVU01002737.1.p1 GENE.GHVU01002737.1~~GHVU01002737.1.p1  ORF type:complete len:129 (+),score=7.47 GHVU01002737.1:138-524(+)
MKAIFPLSALILGLAVGVRCLETNQETVLQVKGVFKFVTPTGREIESVDIEGQIIPGQNDIFSLIDAKVDSELTYGIIDEDNYMWHARPRNSLIQSFTPFVVIGFSKSVSAGDTTAAVLASVHVYLRH